MPRRLCAAILFAFTLFAAGPVYRSASIDGNGQLRIGPAFGKEIVPRRLPTQTAFSDPRIAPNGRAVGWLVEYPNCCTSYDIPLKLAVLNSGRVRHLFGGSQMIWDWDFKDDGRNVAYSTGPTHGGAAECTLADVETGKIVAHWWVRDDQTPPVWAQSLRRQVSLKTRHHLPGKNHKPAHSAPRGDS